MKNPLIKQKTISQKVGDAAHKVEKATQKVGQVTRKPGPSFYIPGKANKYNQYIKKLQQAFLYVSIFLAGYVIGTIQSILF